MRVASFSRKKSAHEEKCDFVKCGCYAKLRISPKNGKRREEKRNIYILFLTFLTNKEGDINATNGNQNRNNN